MKTVVVVDGNNIAFKAFAAFSDKNGSRGAGLLRNSFGVPTTVIFGMLRTFSQFAEQHKVDSLVVAWDMKGGSDYRKSIYPHYKGNRTYTDMTEYFEELDSARSFLDDLGINQAPIKGIEADDIIGFVAKKLSKENKVVIFSDDKDYFQMVSKNIKLWRPCKNEFMTKRDVMKLYDGLEGFKPSRINMIEGMTGQEKDFIPGLCDLDLENKKLVKCGFGPAKAKAVLQKYDWNMKLIKQALKNNETGLSELHTKQLLKNWKQVKLSIDLMRIRSKEKDYNKKDLKKLDTVCEKALAQSIIDARQAISVMNSLEITKIKIVPTLESLGIKIKGSPKFKKRKIKVK